MNGDLPLGHTSLSPFEGPQPVYLTSETRKQSHMLILGAPGSGKSKFMEWMIRDDIWNRRGLCVLDMHGSLFNSVKRPWMAS